MASHSVTPNPMLPVTNRNMHKLAYCRMRNITRNKILQYRGLLHGTANCSTHAQKGTTDWQESGWQDAGMAEVRMAGRRNGRSQDGRMQNWRKQSGQNTERDVTAERQNGFSCCNRQSSVQHTLLNAATCSGTVARLFRLAMASCCTSRKELLQHCIRTGNSGPCRLPKCSNQDSSHAF